MLSGDMLRTVLASRSKTMCRSGRPSHPAAAGRDTMEPPPPPVPRKKREQAATVAETSLDEAAAMNPRMDPQHVAPPRHVRVAPPLSRLISTSLRCPVARRATAAASL